MSMHVYMYISTFHFACIYSFHFSISHISCCMHICIYMHFTLAFCACIYTHLYMYICIYVHDISMYVSTFHFACICVYIYISF